jgi:hypothetical protein
MEYNTIQIKEYISSLKTKNNINYYITFTISAIGINIDHTTIQTITAINAIKNGSIKAKSISILF